ncbi:MAG: hypothetical protein Q9182_005488 [Xanthomendoza sp. 2 TL-2023]
MPLHPLRPSILPPRTFLRLRPLPHTHSHHPRRALINSLASPLRRLPAFIRTSLLTLFTLLTWLPAGWLFWTHVFQLMRVKGPSMYPFLNGDRNERAGGDVVGVWMRGAGLGKDGKVERGGVYVFRSPMNPETIAVKRIIALEGDTVLTRPPYPVPQQEISLGHVWVEGEHPEHTRWSYDSNTYGAARLPL